MTWSRIQGTGVLNYGTMLESRNGTKFSWTPSQNGGGPTVKSLVLAVNETAIVTLENSESLLPFIAG